MSQDEDKKRRRTTRSKSLATSREKNKKPPKSPKKEYKDISPSAMMAGPGLFARETHGSKFALKFASIVSFIERFHGELSPEKRDLLDNHFFHVYISYLQVRGGVNLADSLYDTKSFDHLQDIITRFMEEIAELDSNIMLAYDFLALGRLPPFRPLNGATVVDLRKVGGDIIENCKLITQYSTFRRGRKENKPVRKLVQDIVAILEDELIERFVWTLDFAERGAVFQHPHASLVYDIAHALDPTITLSAVKTALQKVRAAKGSKKVRT